MTAEPRAFRAAEQLAAILEAADLPPRVRAVGERVRARLSSPVRIAVVGQPGAGRRRVVNGLLGSDVLPDLTGLPPCEVSLGAGQTIRAVMADGWEQPMTRDDLGATDPYDLAYLRFDAPLAILEKISLILVPLEGGSEDVAAALAWASARADMILWCTPALDGPDAGLWPGLPERLQDHAFLAVTGPDGHGAARAARDHAACYFREMRSLAPGPGGLDRVAALRAALLSHVSLALREDLEGAILFLDQYVSHDVCARLPGRRPLPALAAPVVPTVPTAPAVRPADAQTGADMGADTDPETGAETGAEDTAQAGARHGTMARPAKALLGTRALPRPLLLENPITATTDTDRAGPADAMSAAGLAGGADGRSANRTPDGSGRGTADEIVGLLRARAEALLPLCEADGGDGIERAARMVLDTCTETLDQCTQLAEDAGGPLADMLTEASEMMLLMRLEGSPTAMSDSVALMLQVRRECEMRAAA